MPYDPHSTPPADPRAFLEATSCAAGVLPPKLFALSLCESFDSVAQERTNYVTLTPTRMPPLGTFEVWTGRAGRGFEVLRLPDDAACELVVICDTLAEAVDAIRTGIDALWSETWRMPGRIDDFLAH